MGNSALKTTYDDIVVGAGILGLAHAYQLARRRRRVAVVEKDAAAVGASVRNFGLLWPIGQPLGPLRRLAQRSLITWLEVLRAAQIPFDPCGVLFLAHHDDEAQVLREYDRLAAEAGDPVERLSVSQVRKLCPLAQSEGLQAGLFSRRETRIEPVAALPGIARWLNREFAVAFHNGRAATRVELPKLWAGDQTWTTRKIWICCGADLGILYPDLLRAAGPQVCKLQMLRTRPLGDKARLGPVLAGGSTLRHYPTFAACPTLANLKSRFAADLPELDRYGIHLLICQNSLGELILGDSHEYAEPPDPEEKSLIEELILSTAKTMLGPPIPEIAARWSGVYVRFPDAPFFLLRPARDVTIVTGAGGAGMTLAFGLADHVVSSELGEDGSCFWTPEEQNETDPLTLP